MCFHFIILLFVKIYYKPIINVSFFNILFANMRKSINIFMYFILIPIDGKMSTFYWHIHNYKMDIIHSYEWILNILFFNLIIYFLYSLFEIFMLQSIKSSYNSFWNCPRPIYIDLSYIQTIYIYFVLHRLKYRRYADCWLRTTWI